MFPYAVFLNSNKANAPRISTWKLCSTATLAVLIAITITALSHSFADVKVAGIAVASDTDQQQLASQIQQRANNYKLTIKNDKTEQRYTLAEAGITVNADKSARQAIAAKQSGSLFANLAWWNDKQLPVAINTNAANLDAFIASKGTQVEAPYKNATVKIDGSKAVAIAGQNGKGYTLNGSKAAIIESARFLNDKPLTQVESSIAPRVSMKAAEVAAGKANKMLRENFVFTVGAQTMTVNNNEVAEWLAFTPNEANRTVDISANRQTVENYINSISQAQNKTALSEVVINYNGSTTTFLSGQNGQGVTNKTAATDAVLSSIRAGRGLTQELAIGDTKYPTITVQADSKYLLVDLTRKRTYAMEGNTAVQTFLASAGAPETPTVTGKYAIYQKFAKQDMRGANADGSNYSQPNVEWVSYFYRDYAVHGNYWRPSNYFGNINSSHGCVGLQNSDAKWIYDWSSIGTPVRVFS